MTNTRPRWESRHQRDLAAMTWWVNDELNKMDTQELRTNLAGENAVDPSKYLGWAIAQADQDRNIEPLRRALPHLARFLQLPKRKRGQRLPRRGFNPVKGAVDDIKRIRNLWKKHYGKIKCTTEPFAESIAADRWKVDVETVFHAMKKVVTKR